MDKAFLHPLCGVIWLKVMSFPLAGTQISVPKKLAAAVRDA